MPVKAGMTMTSQHIPIEQLTDLARNLPTLEEVKEMRSHLADCSECASQLALIEKHAGVAVSHDNQEVRSDLASPDTGFTPTAAETSVIARVMAALSFDSKQLSPAFGIRSGQSVARQLLFSAGEHDLDLRVAPDDGAWVVTGQVLGACSSGQVELRGKNITESAAMNELCEFNLPRVPPGIYSLVVHISCLEIEVPEIELRA